jgi:hypothetical protein
LRSLYSIWVREGVFLMVRPHFRYLRGYGRIFM